MRYNGLCPSLTTTLLGIAVLAILNGDEHFNYCLLATAGEQRW